MNNTTNSFLQHLPLFGLVAVLIPFWQQTRDFLIKVFKIFWKQREIPYDFTNIFYKELCKESLVFDLDEYSISKPNSLCYSFKYKAWIPVIFRLTSFEILLYKNFIPIFISRHEGMMLKIQYLKFTFNFQRFLNKVSALVYDDMSQAYIKKKEFGRFYIEEKRGMSLKQFKNKSSDSNSKTESSSPKPYGGDDKYYILEPYQIVNNKIPKSIGIDINDIVFGLEISEKNKYQFTERGLYVLSQVEKWLKAQHWYEEKNINWRRGILLNGKPGNGKSSLVLEVSKKVGIPLYIFDLSSMDNSEFDKSLEGLTTRSAIILFEDFDNVFNGRNNITKTSQFGGLTFDYFINKLSGVNSIKNKFVFITTNHLEKVDPAILRPGRIDERIEILPLNHNEKLMMAKTILDDNNLINNAMKDSENLTTAEFENKCVQIALENFWNK